MARNPKSENLGNDDQKMANSGDKPDIDTDKVKNDRNEVQMDQVVDSGRKMTENHEIEIIQNSEHSGKINAEELLIGGSGDTECRNLVPHLNPEQILYQNEENLIKTYCKK